MCIALLPYSHLKGFYHIHGLPLWLAWSWLHVQAESIPNIDKVIFFFGKENKPLPSATLECALATGFCGVGHGHHPLAILVSFFTITTLIESLVGDNIGQTSPYMFSTYCTSPASFNKKTDSTSIAVSRPDQVGWFHSFLPTLLRSSTMEIILHFYDAFEFSNLLLSPFLYPTHSLLAQVNTFQ